MPFSSDSLISSIRKSSGRRSTCSLSPAFTSSS
ncbi:Uncharacterised protein [Vibrio cholerae]|nr:Uncharacterised protein [Vibrio cholerae]